MYVRVAHRFLHGAGSFLPLTLKRELLTFMSYWRRSRSTFLSFVDANARRKSYVVRSTNFADWNKQCVLSFAFKRFYVRHGVRRMFTALKLRTPVLQVVRFSYVALYMYVKHTSFWTLFVRTTTGGVARHSDGRNNACPTCMSPRFRISFRSPKSCYLVNQTTWLLSFMAVFFNWIKFRFKKDNHVPITEF